MLSNTQTYYMGCAGGVWKTTDAGVTWLPVTDGQINVGSIGAVAVAYSDPDVVYVGTGTAEPRGNVSNGDGVYKSMDGGKSWQHIGLEKAGLIGRIVIHPENPNVACAAVVGNIFGPNKERGVYRTKDGGGTWEQVLAVSENTGAADISMEMKNPNTLYASMWTVRRQPWTIDSGSMEDGLYRSTDGGANVSLDGGQTWSTVNNQPTAEIYRIEVDTRWPYWVYGAQQDNSTVGVASNNAGEIIPSVGGGDPAAMIRQSRVA